MSTRKNPPSFVLIEKDSGRVVYTKGATGVGSEAIQSCVEKGRKLAAKTGKTYTVFLALRRHFIGEVLNVPMIYHMGITEEIGPLGSAMPSGRRCCSSPDVRPSGQGMRCFNCQRWESDSYLKNPRRVRKNIFIFNNPPSGPADRDAARELELYIDNDSQLYHAQFIPIVKNLMLKRRKGIYRNDLAKKLFMYLMDAGAKKYVAEFGTRGQKIDSMFNRNTRLLAANHFVFAFESEAELGNYDRLIGPVSNPRPRRKREHVIRCLGCGRTISLDEVDNQYGDVECVGCGQWYNAFGQRIKPPGQWTENPLNRKEVAQVVNMSRDIARTAIRAKKLGDASRAKANLAYGRGMLDTAMTFSPRGARKGVGNMLNRYNTIERRESSRSNPGVRENIYVFNNPRGGKYGLEGTVARAARAVGLLVTTWSPGDGVTRYRFFVAKPGERYADYHQGGAIYTANGRGEALAFLKSYGIGRSRMNPSREAQKFISKKIGILRREGRPTAQSAAIAYSMARKRGFRVNPSPIDPPGLVELDARMNDLMRRMDAMKKAKTDNGPDYMILLKEAQAVSKERMKLLGLGGKVIRPNPLLQTVFAANPPISDRWASLTRRQRHAILEFAGYPDDYAWALSPGSWASLPSNARVSLERAWLDTSSRGGTTRRRSAVPVGANPLTRKESGKILRSAKRSLAHGAAFRPGHTRSAMVGKAIGKAHVVTDFGPRSARPAAMKIHDRAQRLAGTAMSNPGPKLPKPGTRMTVAQALELARRIGDRSLIDQCQKALKLQTAANRSSKCVIWKTFPMGSKDRIDQVVALTHYGDSPETMYKPPKGSKKGPHMYRHKWGEGGGGKKSVPLLASADGKMLLMPLEGKKIASDWLRH